MITDDKKSILERVNFFVFFSFDLTLIQVSKPGVSVSKTGKGLELGPSKTTCLCDQVAARWISL